jgi:hypothetical protein
VGLSSVRLGRDCRVGAATQIVLGHVDAHKIDTPHSEWLMVDLAHTTQRQGSGTSPVAVCMWC